ncbi:MAG: Glycerol-3-phosphate dehydrogenase [NAD(P)+] [Candidatus Nomurabacteria bacterium GW2011_GWD2_36_14]|nr:MAG: Glycerol-3-phosphate dehydrogenase [NAD(P)+] [Candidatus Nomurabacteria bacterium GW2011_GWD2_36_14]
MKISILGYGTFGQAIATRLIINGHEILINEVKGSDMILVATPSYRVKEALLEHKEFIINQKIIICSKGFNEDGDLISTVLGKEFPHNSIYFLYGPTLAEGLINGDLSAMVLAGGSSKEEVKKQIESQNLKIELSDDVVGVQIGAAMKNVVTIFVGIAEGASYGQNTQAYIFTKGLQEIQKLGVSLGAEPNTFIGLTCSGDLSLRSRNRLLGIEIGKGRKIENIVAKKKYMLEGLATIKNHKNISSKLGVELPFVDILFSIIFEGYSVEEGIRRIV